MLQPSVNSSYYLLVEIEDIQSFVCFQILKIVYYKVYTVANTLYVSLYVCRTEMRGIVLI